ncbi:stage V sporulation protein AC [Ihubacter sp. rT4E-8]|uniref:stage V sporulation protein AC n=1 Tax=unclassified Ihubacter TaxID=2633299 RepID=UPI00137AE36E
MAQKTKQKEVQKKDVAKAYEKYTKQFTPKPTYFANCLRAFLIGGLVCTAGYYINNMLIARGLSEKDAGLYVTIGIVALAQLLTGFGVFDSIAKFAGAGVIVPISGFANSMVAPAIEYKKEGLVLGVGAKLFSVAGPVLVCGITSATIVGIIYWIIGLF